MNRLLCGTFLVIFIFLYQVLQGQDFPMRHYTIEDGLPSNTVYDIYRDSKGFLWISTDKGVVRYNGIRFETFTTFNGLPDNEIFFSQEDLYGRLWFSTYNGELCYYKNDTFHTAINTPFLKLPFKTSFIKGVIVEKVDSSVTIFFMEDLKFIRIFKDKCIVDSVRRRDASEYYNIVHIQEKYGDTAFKIFFKDKIVYIGKNGQLLDFKKISLDSIVVFYNVQGQTHFFDKRGIYDLDEKSKKFFSGNFFSKHILNRIFYSGKNEFLATTTGLLLNDTIAILRGYNTSTITEDFFGHYWIGTLNDGIYNLPINFANIKIYRNTYRGKVKFSFSQNGNIFFTNNENNLYHFRDGRSVCLFDKNKDGYSRTDLNTQPCYFLDQNNKYYIFYGNEHTIVSNVLDPKRTIRRYVNDTLMGIKNIFLVGDYLYFQNRNRIRKLDYSKLKIGGDIISHLYNIPEPQKANRIFGMAQAPDKSLWYSTLDHLYKIVNDVAVEQPLFDQVSLKSFGFYGNKIIGYTQNNRLVICENYNGEVIIDSISPQNCIWEKLFQLDSTHVLISTNGLYRVLTLYPFGSKERFSVFTIENQFIPLHVEAICVEAGDCYFFKDGAITSIDVKSILAKHMPPKIIFTFLKAGKKSYPIEDDLSLSYNESRNVAISFSRLLVDGQEISQQYAISKNGQENWVDVKGEEINLVNAGYGDYTVKLRAKTLSSDYCIPIVFTFHILRPFWATRWFIMCLIAVAILIVIFAAKFRIRYIVHKNEREHNNEMKFIKSEYKALNALMNPHFVFNTLNNVQGLVNRNDRLAANEYIRVFADLIRQNMHNLSKELIPLQKEVDLVVNYLLLEKLRFKDLLNYTLNIDDNIDLSEIMVPPLLIQPLVENSIKHGILPLESVEGTVQVNIYEREGTLHIEVKDNGVGMDKSREKSENSLHESFGMDNIKRRMQQLSIILDKEITLNIREEHEAGKRWTVVTINMPNS